MSTAAAFLVGGAIVAGFVATRPGPAAGCADVPALRVVADPSLAPTLTQLAQSLTPGADQCPKVTVQELEPVDEVTALGNGSVRSPDVWIPDSTIWLDRSGVKQVAGATNLQPIASSPLVLAVSRGVADQLASGGRPTVSDIAAATGQGQPFIVELSTKPRSPERVGTILALSAATAGGPDARAALTGILRSARASNVLPSERLGSLSQTEPVAVPASEHDVWAANTAGIPSHPVAVYPGAVTFDFPYAVLATDAATRDRADEFFGLLRGQRGQAAMRDAGFRDIHGTGGPALTTNLGVDGTKALGPQPLSAASLDRAERALTSVSLDARLLAIMDVSGSMAWPAAGRQGTGPSRLSVAAQAAARGLALYPDTTEVGLWAFSQDIVGDIDYREVVPVTTLGGHGGSRSRLAAAMTHIAPVPGGDTALYATTVAAVRAMQDHWVAGRVNAVVLLSDGKDTNPKGPSLSQVVAMLTSARTSTKPVPVITVAFGPQSDVAALAAISTASGGASYRADSADQVRQIFLDAVGQRACRPHCAG